MACLAAASIEDVLARIENEINSLAALTGPETLTGWDAPRSPGWLRRTPGSVG